MVELLVSTRQFFGGILRRFYYWAPTIFLDPFDFYERWFKPYSPPWVETYMNTVSAMGPIVLFVMLTWAAILSYHELRLKVNTQLRVRMPTFGWYLLKDRTVAWVISVSLTNKSFERPIGISNVYLEIKRGEEITGQKPLDQTAVDSLRSIEKMPKPKCISANPLLRPGDTVTGEVVFQHACGSLENAECTLIFIDNVGKEYPTAIRAESLRWK